MGDSDRVSRTQMLAVCVMALLSPVIRQFPHAAAVPAGSACWIAPAAALPLAAGLILVTSRLVARLGAGEGLGELLLRCLGKAGGRGFLCLYSLWLLFYAGFVLRSGADRFITAVYPGSRPLIFIIVMYLLALMAALRGFRVLARTAVIFRIVLAAVLICVFAFALPEVKTDYLLPVGVIDIPGVALAALAVLNTLSLIINFAFLEPHVNPDRPFVRSYLPQSVILLVCVTLLCVTVTGAFGPELAVKINYPFFVMIRNITVFNILDRVEALIITLWVMTDFVLVASLLFIADANFRLVLSAPRPKDNGRLFSMRGGRLLTWIISAPALAAALVIAPSALELPRYSDVIVPVANAAMIFVAIPLALLVGKLRRRL